MVEVNLAACKDGGVLGRFDDTSGGGFTFFNILDTSDIRNLLSVWLALRVSFF